MKLKTLAMGAATLMTLAAVPSMAEAAWGQATGNVNMRVAADPSAPKVLTIPAHARIWVGQPQGNGWFQVTYAGQSGFVSGNYIATAVAMGGPNVVVRGPAPRFGFVHKPWWDNQHQAWYDGRRWYRNGIWYNSPSGFSFGFNFGG